MKILVSCSAQAGQVRTIPLSKVSEPTSEHKGRGSCDVTEVGQARVRAVVILEVLLGHLPVEIGMRATWANGCRILG